MKIDFWGTFDLLLEVLAELARQLREELARQQRVAADDEDEDDARRPTKL